MRKLYGNDDPSLFASLVDTASAESAPVVVPRAPDGIAAAEVDRVVSELRRDGYSILGDRVDPAILRDLESTARAATCAVIVPGDPTPRRLRFDETDPVGIRYDLDEQDIVRCVGAQLLLADESLLKIAHQYLGTTPIQDLIAMWWSTAVSPEASAAAAQAFHFDLDRLRFLKVFVYVTDVDATTGPHVYVRGSHLSMPRALREDRRYSDEEVAQLYQGEAVTITGPAGTVFLADTRGLHKGLRLVEGSRLVFQLEFATSLFGAGYARPTIDVPVGALAEMQRRYPATYRRFRLGGEPHPE